VAHPAWLLYAGETRLTCILTNFLEPCDLALAAAMMLTGVTIHINSPCQPAGILYSKSSSPVGGSVDPHLVLQAGHFTEWNWNSYAHPHCSGL